ncbi:MAG: HU family DNA-binding protein [Pseudomonadota bacterium]
MTDTVKSRKTARAAPRKTTSTARKRTARAPAITTMPTEETDSVENDQVFKRNDLLDAVAARSAMARSDLRAVIELVLDEVGGALTSGHDLALAPLGRIKVQKRKSTDGAEVMTLRLRRKSETPETVNKA